MRGRRAAVRVAVWASIGVVCICRANMMCTTMLAAQVHTIPRLALTAALSLHGVYPMQQLLQSSMSVFRNIPYLIFLFCNTQHVSQAPCMAA